LGDFAQCVGPLDDERDAKAGQHGWHPVEPLRVDPHPNPARTTAIVVHGSDSADWLPKIKVSGHFGLRHNVKRTQTLIIAAHHDPCRRPQCIQ
jgi:hypothetical protein